MEDKELNNFLNLGDGVKVVEVTKVGKRNRKTKSTKPFVPRPVKNKVLENFEEISKVEIKEGDEFDEIIDSLNSRKAEIDSKVEEVFKSQLAKIENDVVDIQTTDLDARIYVWLMNGWTRPLIVSELVKLGYSERQSKLLITNVVKSFAAVQQESVDSLRNMYIDMYSDLYRRAIEKKDYTTAKNVLDSVTKLQGLITKKSETKVENVFKVEF